MAIVGYRYQIRGDGIVNLSSKPERRYSKEKRSPRRGQQRQVRLTAGEKYCTGTYDVIIPYNPSIPLHKLQDPMKIVREDNIDENP